MSVTPSLSTERWPALALHHDLWVELARVELVLEKLDGGAPGTGASRHKLEQRQAELTAALHKLAV